MSRILIIAPHWIGDAVMSLPLVALIKQNLPNATIDVLCTPWVAPIYHACPNTQEVIEFDFQHGSLQWNLRYAAAQQLKLRGYESAFVLPNSLKSALIPWLARIPIRIGYRGEFRYGLINHALPNPPRHLRTPMLAHYAALFKQLANNAVSLDTLPEPRLQISSDARQKVHERLAMIAHNLFYVFAPGAEYGSAKRWPSSHFAQLANHILGKEADSQIVILGSHADHSIGREIQQSANHRQRIHNWSGELSLDQSMALIAQSQSLISNDSGLMHIGAALSIPQIAIFGSSSPQHTPPQSRKAKVIWLGLPCSPCYKRTCPLGHLNCLMNIRAEHVYAMLTELHS
jgi:heptosyltransferase-2